MKPDRRAVSSVFFFVARCADLLGQRMKRHYWPNASTDGDEPRHLFFHRISAGPRKMSNPERQHGKEPRRRSLQGLCLSQSRSRPQQFRFETAIPLPGRKNKSIPRRPSSPKWSIFGRQKQKTTTRNSSLKISATETNKKKTSRKSTNYNRGNGIRVVAQRTLFLPFCRRCCSCCFLLYDIFFWVPYKGRAADAKIQSDSATLRGGNSIGEEEKEAKAKAKEKEKRGALICMRLEGDLHTAPRPRTSYSVDRAT